MRKFNRNLSVLLILLCGLLLCGCGASETEKINAFHDNVATFCDNIEYLDELINAIDTENADNVSALLLYLDKVDEQFAALAGLSFPSDYAYLQETAQAASEYMTLAVATYHEAFEAEVFDYETAAAAEVYYESAVKRLQLFLSFLRGE